MKFTRRLRSRPRDRPGATSGGIERDTSLRREVSPCAPLLLFLSPLGVDLLRTASGTSARRKSHFTRSREGQVTRASACTSGASRATSRKSGQDEK